jgi:hypothetical protein
MNPKDKHRVKILAVLLVIFGVTLVLAYQLRRPSTASAIEPTAQQARADGSRNPTKPSDARIRLDLVEKDPVAENAGDTNVFQYRAGRAQPPAASLPPPVLITESPRPVVPPPPPPPPPIPLKYNGYANAHSGLTAFLTDDQKNFSAINNDVLMGRYRIVRVTTTNVEVEDLEHNRRQVLPLLK